MGVCFLSCFELWFGGRRRTIVVVLRKVFLSGLIAILRAMILFLTVETFAFFEQFLVFRRHGVDVHGIGILVLGCVLVVLVLSRILVVLGGASHCSYKVLPVVVK